MEKDERIKEWAMEFIISLISLLPAEDMPKTINDVIKEARKIEKYLKER